MRLAFWQQVGSVLLSVDDIQGAGVTYAPEKPGQGIGSTGSTSGAEPAPKRAKQSNRAPHGRGTTGVEGMEGAAGGGGERGWGAVVRRRLVNPCEYNVLNDGQAGWGAGWHVVALRTCHCMCVCVCARARACVCMCVCMCVCVCSATAASPSSLYAVGGASFQSSPLLMKRRRRREAEEEEEEEKEGLFKADAVNEDPERDGATQV